MKGFAGSKNIRVIVERGNRLTVNSAESQEAVRGADFSMVHLTEVAYWPRTPGKAPEDLVRAICSAVHYGPQTLIALESTANGTGDFFHREWRRACGGESSYEPVFVAWHEVDYYRLEVDDKEELLARLDAYERRLLDELGLDLEQVNWYHCKRREFAGHVQMMAEFPTTADEAFISSANGVFGHEAVERLRRDTRPPLAVGDLLAEGLRGPEALRGLRFVPEQVGPMSVWHFPETEPERMMSQRYVVGVDIGGVSDKADWSVISVMDCGLDAQAKPEVVAVWRGHIDHDLLAWKCAAIARWYCDALLVVEANTLESEHTDGDPSSYILANIARHYRHLFYRTDIDGRNGKPGFHMNRTTKSALITELVAKVRGAEYIERDSRACDEYSQYERLPNGSYGARDGCHDDILMTRALIFGVLHSRRVTPRAAVSQYINYPNQ